MTVAEPQNVPRFGLQADVDEFVSVLERFEKGELTADEWRKFRLVRGTYGQRQEGVQMQRVKIPLGYLVASQARVLADCADRFAAGKAHLTTRQNFQFHFVQLKDVEALTRVLADAGITAREACGNAVRNVTGCDLAGVAKTALFDTRPHGEALVRFFLRHPKAADLPRKFKIAVSCCPHDCAQAAIHDVGLVATIKDGQRGFRVLVGGGLSTSPQAAVELYDFLPETQILELSEAVLLVFDARGNRTNKHRARLKYVLRDIGADGLRAAIDVERAKIRVRGDAPIVLEATPLPTPPPKGRATPLTGDLPVGYLAFRGSNVKEQSQDGYASVYVRMPLGDVTSADLRNVADLAEKYGDGSVYTSAEQNLLLRFVPVGDLKALYADLVAVNLGHHGALGLLDVTSCPGADSCNLAVTTSRGLGRAIERTLADAMASPQYAAVLEQAGDTHIKISGCPHSCGRHHIADLGFHGAARKIGGKAMPVYQLHLGGGVDARGARFGGQIVKIPAKRIPALMLRFLDAFAKERREGEQLGAYLGRLTPEHVKLLTKDLADIDPAVAKDDEYLDFDAQNGFVVETKAGECAA